MSPKRVTNITDSKALYTRAVSKETGMTIMPNRGEWYTDDDKLRNIGRVLLSSLSADAKLRLIAEWVACKCR